MHTTIAGARTCLLAASALVAGCDSGDGTVGDARSFDRIQDEGTLVIATRNAPTTWYIDRDGEPGGPEHDLVESFAEWLDVDTEYRIHHTITEVMSAVDRRDVDFAAAGLTITESRQENFRFGPPYQAVKQQLVCRRGGPQPQAPAEMVDHDIHVIADSTYVERLEELQRDQPELEWTERDDVTTEMLLQAVWDRRIDCTVADSTIVAMNRRLFPELVISQDLTDEQHLGWLLPPESEGLAEAMDEWMAEFRATSLLARHEERFYGPYQRFDYVDIRRFIRRINERFRGYEHWFREAAEQYDIPYTLLAALAYQESHWDPDAVSPTGVRGIMMLTLRAAEEVEVDDRLDPRQSIFGGARYLDWMRSRISDEVEEPDRTYLALAAYNVGRGHLHDAQSLARELGKDPHSWADMQEVLPKLADPAYYRDLRYGYARGHEPVIYVTRIREFVNVLEDYLYGHPSGLTMQ